MIKPNSNNLRLLNRMWVLEALLRSSRRTQKFAISVNFEMKNGKNVKDCDLLRVIHCDIKLHELNSSKRSTVFFLPSF